MHNTIHDTVIAFISLCTGVYIGLSVASILVWFNRRERDERGAMDEMGEMGEAGWSDEHSGDEA